MASPSARCALERDLFASLRVPAPRHAHAHEAVDALGHRHVRAYDFMPGQPDRLQLQVNRHADDDVLRSAWG